MNIFNKLAMLIVAPASLMGSATLLTHSHNHNSPTHEKTLNNTKQVNSSNQLGNYDFWDSFKELVLEEANPQKILNMLVQSKVVTTSSNWNKSTWYGNANLNSLYTPEWDNYGGLNNNDPAGGINLMHGAPIIDNANHSISMIISIKGHEGMQNACPIKATILYVKNAGIYNINSWDIKFVTQWQSKQLFNYELIGKYNFANKIIDDFAAYLDWFHNFAPGLYADQGHTTTLTQQLEQQLVNNQVAKGYCNRLVYFNYKTIRNIKGGIQYKINFHINVHRAFWSRIGEYSIYCNFISINSNSNITATPYNSVWWPDHINWITSGGTHGNGN